MRTFVFDRRVELPHPPDTVWRVLDDLARYPSWWPQVLAVASLGPDDARVLCRSRLPYTLDLVLHAESRDRTLLESSLTGDLEGVVRWRLSEAGAGTRVEFEQEVRVTGRLLGLAAYVVGPALRWNHEQMMSDGVTGLRQVLAERR